VLTRQDEFDDDARYSILLLGLMRYRTKLVQSITWSSDFKYRWNRSCHLGSRDRYARQEREREREREKINDPLTMSDQFAHDTLNRHRSEQACSLGNWA